MQNSLYFYNNMMKEIREAIEEGRYQSYKKSMLESLAGGEQQVEYMLGYIVIMC